MRVKATWHHVIGVTREIEIDDEAFASWRSRRYPDHADHERVLSVWIEQLDTEEIAAVFPDWKTSEPLPADFELQWSEVVDVEAGANHDA